MCTHTLVGYDDARISLFFRMNQDFLYNVVMAGCVYRRRNERYADCCVLERDRFGGGGSAMVCAAIARGYRSPTVVIDGNLNAQRYRDDILAHQFF